MQFTIFCKTHFFWLFWAAENGTNFKFQWNLTLHCFTLLNNSSYKPHGTYVSGFTFLLHQEGPKKPQSFFSLSSQGWNSLPGACSDLDVHKQIRKLTILSQFDWSINIPLSGNNIIIKYSSIDNSAFGYWIVY